MDLRDQAALLQLWLQPYRGADVTKKIRLYEVSLAAEEKPFTANEKLHPLKQKYIEYLEGRQIMTEARLIKLLATGRVLNARFQGCLAE